MTANCQMRSLPHSPLSELMQPFGGGDTLEAEIKLRPPSVILVHGAWMDGSSWREVIALLQRKAIDVVAAQCHLMSLMDDVDVVNRLIARQRGPVVLVGHGYGGTVITQAGTHSDVAALLFVAAVVPDVRESTSDCLKQSARNIPENLAEADANGITYLLPRVFEENIAHDLPRTESRVLAAVQVPIHRGALDASVSAAAWQTKPTAYLVTEQDRMLSPDAQRAFAERARAKLVSISAGHVPFLSKPRETTDCILRLLRSINGGSSKTP